MLLWVCIDRKRHGRAVLVCYNHCICNVVICNFYTYMLCWYDAIIKSHLPEQWTILIDINFKLSVSASFRLYHRTTKLFVYHLQQKQGRKTHTFLPRDATHPRY